MKQMSVRQARQALSRLDEVFQAEEEVTITKRGKAVARLIPLGRKATMPSHGDLRSKMKPMKDDSATLLRRDRDAR